METIAVVRSEYGGQTELDVPGVTEHGHDVGQGQVQLLLTDRGEAGPAQVTAEAPLIHRVRAGQLCVSAQKFRNHNNFIRTTALPCKSFLTSRGFQ